MMSSTKALVGLAAAVASLLLLAGPADGSVVGIDLGSRYMKVASGLEIVTNFESKRKSDTMIAFDRG